MFAMSIIKRTPLVSSVPRTDGSPSGQSVDCGKRGLSEQEIILVLQGIASFVQRADEECAYGAFMHLMRRLEGCGEKLAFKARLFAQALIKAIDPVPEDEINIYLRQYERSHIDLFNLLADSFPLTAYTTAVANLVTAELITAAVLDGVREITLLDLGIGSGRQISGLIRMLAERGSSPLGLTVFGVDPVAGNLEQAAAGLTAVATALRIRFQFVPVRAAVEDLTPDDWMSFRRFGGELFATATFSLHHVGRDGNGFSRKDEVLRNLKLTGPSALVLTEASSDFETDDLASRFVESWMFYGACFDILDRMSLAPALRAAAELFFRRELEDTIGGHSAHRCERFDTATRWRERLQHAGFRTHPLLARIASRHIAPEPGDLISTVFQDSRIDFTHDDHVVATVTCTY
jgi:SAM-dependent methyltransferase